MLKKLSAIGNSLGIVNEANSRTPRHRRETELEMRNDGERLIITPVRGAKRATVLTTAQGTIREHDASLRKLGK
jgi:antitoxin MazE